MNESSLSIGRVSMLTFLPEERHLDPVSQIKNLLFTKPVDVFGQILFFRGRPQYYTRISTMNLYLLIEMRLKILYVHCMVLASRASGCLFGHPNP